MKELLDYLRELIGKGKKFLILGHPHADPDAAGSAIALGKILESCGSEVQVGVPSNLDGLTKSVLESIGLDIQIDPPLDTDVMVVLDTSKIGRSVV